MRKLYPMLEFLSELPASKLEIVLPHLKPAVSLGLLECVDHSVCNKSIPPDVRDELREKLIKHKNKFRYLVNKDEYATEDNSEREEILDKKMEILAQVADCLQDVFKVAIPALADYVSVGKASQEHGLKK